MSFRSLAIVIPSLVLGSVVQAQTTTHTTSRLPVKNTISAVEILSPGQAIVVGQHGEDFAAWCVDAAKPTWTRLIPPAAATPGRKPVWNNVETHGHDLLLFGFDDGPGAGKQTLLQAASTNLGATWQVSRSVFSSGGYERVGSYLSSDDDHAWLLAYASPGAGALGTGLFTTANRGKLWRQVQASGGNEVMNMGINFPSLLHATNATSAWFIASCPICSPNDLTASYTVDEGRTFQAAAISKKYPCGDCVAESVSDATSTLGDCFNADLVQDDPGNPTHVHFCTKDGGKTWGEPLPGAAPVPPAPPLLMVSTKCRDMPKDAKHTDPWSHCVLQQSLDGGKTFALFPANITALGASNALSFAAKGDEAWLVTDSDKDPMLLHSADKGESWKIFPMR